MELIWTMYSIDSDNNV